MEFRVLVRSQYGDLRLCMARRLTDEENRKSVGEYGWATEGDPGYRRLTDRDKERALADLDEHGYAPVPDAPSVSLNLEFMKVMAWLDRESDGWFASNADSMVWIVNEAEWDAIAAMQVARAASKSEEDRVLREQNAARQREYQEGECVECGRLTLVRRGYCEECA